jgi:hypothetical protein
VRCLFELVTREPNYSGLPRPLRLTVLPEFMNASHMIEGFKCRRDIWHRAAKKMSATGA